MCGRGSSSPWPLQEPRQEHSGNAGELKSYLTEWPPGFPQFLRETGERKTQVMSGAEHLVWMTVVGAVKSCPLTKLFLYNEKTFF